MHITINTITRKVIIHDLTLTKTELVVKMLQAIGENADNWQIEDKEDFLPKFTFVDKGNYDQVEKLFGMNKEKPCITRHEIPPLKNLTNPDDGAAMS